MSKKIVILVQTLIKVFITLSLIGSLSAQSLLNRTIELKKDGYRSEELVKELQEVHSLSIGFGRLPSKEIQFSTKQITLREALDQLVKDTNFTYQLLNNKVLIVDKGNQSGRATVSGYIKDEETGEALIGATIYDKVSGSGVVSNNYGFYSLTLPAGIVDLHIQYLGFEDQQLELALYENFTHDFVLPPSTNMLEEVTVEGSLIESIELSPQTSTISLTPKQIENVPMVLGEHDVLKALQLLPGIQAGSEGSSGIYVRGGGPDQNLILMDGVPVYNTSHVFGAFSIFNSDAINQVEVIKGGFPARYGGRLSSVIDISMKEGNNKKLSGVGSIGLISSKFSIEGPIKNEKTSFIVSGRRSYLDLLAIPFDVKDENNYYFYDFNAKINHRFSSTDRVFISFYGGKDLYEGHRENYVLGLRNKQITDSGFNWGNLISVVRWTHIFNPRLFAKFSGTYSQFQFNTYDERFTTTTASKTALTYASGIKDYSTTADFEFIPQPAISVKFGASAVLHEFNTGVLNYDDESSIKQSGGDKTNAGEYATYFESDFEVGSKLRFNLGAHISLFAVDGTTYSSLQPRFTGRYLIRKALSLKASYSEMRQFIHLLTNGGVGLPTDLWVPATNKVNPQFSRQVAIGLSQVFRGFEFSIESYYKQMEDLIEYQNGASYISTNARWEDKVAFGNGSSYGTEFLIRKTSGRLTGWIGYTWSKTTRQFDELNFGRPFDYKYDRRHDLSVTNSYSLGRGFVVSGTWIYGTGNALSIPTSRYVNPIIPEQWGESDLSYLEHLFYNNQIATYDQRNNYRMRSYNRLDLAISWEKQKKKVVRTWKMGVYNAYNRQNPFYVYIENSSGNNAMYEPPTLKQVSLFPAIPFINYSLKF